jgi:hypothetical protein
MTKSNPPQHTAKKRGSTKKREATAQKRKIPLERQEKKEEIDWKCDSPAYEKPVSPTYGPNSPSYTPAQVEEPVSPSRIPAQAEEPVSPTYGPDSPSYSPSEDSLIISKANAVAALGWLAHKKGTFDYFAPNVFTIRLSPPELLMSEQANGEPVARVHISTDEEFRVLCAELLLPLLRDYPACKEIIVKSAIRYLESTTGLVGLKHQDSELVIREFPLLSGRRYDPRDDKNTLLACHAMVIFDSIRVYANRFSPADHLRRLDYVMSRSTAEVERITRILYGLEEI